MHIAQIIDTLYVGGAEQLLLTYTKKSVARDIHPTIISLSACEDSPLPEQLIQAGAKVVEFPGRNLFDPFRFIRLLQFLRHQRFDVLHAHLEYAVILGIVAGLITSTPVVVTLHNMRMNRWGKLANFLIRSGAQQVIAVGPSVAKAYQSAVGTNIRVEVNPIMPIPLLVEAEDISLRREIAVDPTRPLILSVGRVTAQKGFGYLLAGLDILRRTHPQVFLAIAGWGWSLDELTAQVQSLNLQNHVRFLGLRDDVPRLMAASDIYVSSSLWEGMPVSILEAMAAGLPVVATAVGDVPYVVREETGLLVSPASPEQLSSALALLLDDPSLREQLGLAGRKYVSKFHNPDVWFHNLLAIYQDNKCSSGKKN